MAVHNAHTTKTARMLAKRMRKKGYKATIYKVKGKPPRVSVTRK